MPDKAPNTYACDFCQGDFEGWPQHVPDLPGIDLCPKCKARHYEPEQVGKSKISPPASSHRQERFDQ